MKKYVVSQEFMNKLEGWKHDLILEDAFFVNQEAINNMPKIIKNWWVDDYETIGESNKRLISIIRYMSGANDFEVEKPKNMSEKYVVSQEFMNELEEWKKRGNTDVYFVGSYDISMLPIDVIRWWDYPEINNSEQNNRLIAIIRWVNGEDVFEVEKPKKWVVRTKETDDDGEHWYVSVNLISPDFYASDDMNILEYATKFDTKEEAQ